MLRKDYTEHVVAALNGESAPEIVEAIRRNYGVDEGLAKLALRRAIRNYKEKKKREKDG